MYSSSLCGAGAALLYVHSHPFKNPAKTMIFLFKIPYLYETGNEWDNKKQVLMYYIGVCRQDYRQEGTIHAGKQTTKRQTDRQEYMQERRQTYNQHPFC